MLGRLNRGSGMETDGEHIGITNVMQRFYLFYGKDRVGFAFSNADPGAKIEIFIQDPDVRSGKTEASLSEVGI
jgi:sensor histidine kinase YesM